jgi:hypothetical protein
MKHENSGHCPKCQEILDRYSGFNEDLREWFEDFQEEYPEAHVSCAGRGRDEQEAAFKSGASRAHFGESAHNWNCAMDLFALIPQANTIYPREWFNNILAPALPDWIEWYGSKGAEFFELPHIEVKGWRELRKQMKVHLVE